MDDRGTSIFATPRLPQPEQLLVITDFKLARQHLLFFFKQKLSHWQALPLILLGIGHVNLALARGCGRKALALYDSARDQSHHFVTKQFCTPASAGREQLEAFCVNFPYRDLDVLPMLHLHASKSLFTMVTERWIESRHALTKRHLATAPHASCVHVAWSMVLSSLRRHWSSNGRGLGELAACMTHTRNNVVALQTVGLYRHPSVQAILQDSQGKKTPLHHIACSLVKSIIFHVDGGTMFRDYSNFQVAPPPPDDDGDEGGPNNEDDGDDDDGHGLDIDFGDGQGPDLGCEPPIPEPGPDSSCAGIGSSSSGGFEVGQSARSGAGFGMASSSGGASSSSLDLGRQDETVVRDVWADAAIHFLRHLHMHTSSRMAYSIGRAHVKSISDPFLQKLEDVLGTQVPVVAISGDSDGFDVQVEKVVSLPSDHSSPSADAQVGKMEDSGIVFFSILNTHPYRRKLPPGSTGIQNRLAVVVTLLSFQSHSKTEKVVRVAEAPIDSDGLDTVQLLTPNLMTPEDLQTLIVWDVSPELQHSIVGFQPAEFAIAVPDALQRLIAAGASPESPEVELCLWRHEDDTDGSCRGALAQLAQHGYAQELREFSDRSFWKMTPLGQSSLQTSFALRHPRIKGPKQLNMPSLSRPPSKY